MINSGKDVCCFRAGRLNKGTAPPELRSSDVLRQAHGPYRVPLSTTNRATIPQHLRQGANHYDVDSPDYPVYF